MNFSKKGIAVAILLWTLMMFPAVMPGAVITTLNFVSHGSATNTPTDGVFGGLNGAPLGTGVINIPPNPAWFNLPGANWVSLAQTGDPGAFGYVTFPNGTVLGLEHDFYIDPAYTILSATLKFLADDTAAGQLNGTHVFTASTTQGTVCAANAPACLASTQFTADVIGLVHTGWNGFYADVFQLFGSSTGAEWSMLVTVNTSPVPEPATFGLIGLGLVVLSSIRRQRS